MCIYLSSFRSDNPKTILKQLTDTRVKHMSGSFNNPIIFYLKPSTHFRLCINLLQFAIILK